MNEEAAAAAASPLALQHPRGELDPRPRGRRVHLCVACRFPIAVYGRCAPCLHIYCLTCASDMAACLICQVPIIKLERIPGEAGGVFVSPATLQGFRSEADLARHMAELGSKLAAMGAAAPGALAGSSVASVGGLVLPPVTRGMAEPAAQQRQQQQAAGQPRVSPRYGMQPTPPWQH